MNIHELDTYDLGDAVKFNDKLNPRIWDANERMRPEVREQLLRIADDFREFLGIDVEVKDITVSGSNAAYTYTPHSDIDLHLVVDLPRADENAVYRELFDAKKYAYNDMHDIRIGGSDVELYVQDANKTHHSQGIYSIMNDDWVSVPKRRRPDVDDISVKSKFEDLGHRIESAIATGDLDKITDMAEKLRDYRQAGLDAHGEFGAENLAFKILRTQGLIEKLYAARNQAKDDLLSLDERRKKKKRSVKYGYGAYWYPGTAYAGQDHPAGTEGGGDGGGGNGGESLKEVSMSPDGVNPSTTMVVSDITDVPTAKKILSDFVEFAATELSLDELPAIKLRRDPQWPVVNRTFGRYNDDARTLEVSWGQRHIMDVLRTVAHELTHKHQHEREAVPDDAGETGSKFENEANARAGMLMRDYAAQHPEYFARGTVDEGIKQKAAAMAAAACLIPGTPGCSSTGQVLRTTQDVGRTAQTIGKMTRAGVQDEISQELRNFIRAQGGDPNAQNQSTLYQYQRRMEQSKKDKMQNEGASGYIPTKKQARDPRFSMALTVDVKPGQVGKEANKLKLKTDKQGRPQTARANGLFETLMAEYALVKEGIQAPVAKGKDAEQYYKFILGKAQMGRPLTRAEQDYVKMYQMYRQQKLAEFAPGAQRDDRGPDEEEILRQYAAQWYNGDEDPRVEKLLATMGWEIGQNEDEAGGAFVIRSGDINGDSFISWTDAELSALNEISDELRRSYLGRAGQQVDRRQTRMAQVRDRLNKGYEIYHAEDPTRIVHRFEANTPAEARRYYERYDADYDSDVDYDLQLRRATGLEENLNELALRSTLPVTQIMNHRSKQIYNLKTQSGEYQIVLDISNKDDNFDDDPDYDGPTGYILDIYFVGRNSDGNWSQWNTNVGEKQVAQIFSTIAQLAVKIIKAHPEIDEIGIKGADPQRSRIYSRLMQQNIDSLLPGWKLGGEGLVREKPQQAVAEVIKMPPVNMVFSNENLVDWAYNDAQKKQARQLQSLKIDVPTRVYDMGDHLRVFVIDDQGPVLYLALEKFLDGFKTNAVQIHPRGQGKNLAFKVYQAVSDTFQRPLYSDQTHTDASRLGIWKKLIDKFPNRLVGYDQATREDLPLTATDQGPVVRGKEPIYVQKKKKDLAKPVTPQTRSRTRLLKFLPATAKQAVAEGKIKLYTDPNYFGAEVDDYKASGPVVNIPDNRLVGFEPDDKMDQPASKANVEKIVAGLKQGAKLPPLLVRKYKNGYQVLDGHHRFWAYKLLGIKAIPAQVVPDEDIKELVESEELDEVNMSPGALEKFATSDAAKGIRAGFEAELIFRDTQGSSDDLDPEPDYDADERAYSISQVIEFFDNDEYGYGLTDRERNRLEERLDEAYMQWRDDQITSDFRNDAEDLIRDVLLEETPMSERINVYLTDSMQRSDKEADRIIAAGVDAPKFNTSKDQAAYAAENPDYAAYLEAADAAEIELDESVEYSVKEQDGYWDEALDDYRDNYSGDDDSFFSDIGLRWMSDVANEYGLDWPVWDLDNQRNEGSRSWEDIGSELQAVVDMPVVVSDNYHSTSRRPGQWIIEPDGSLHADDQSEEAGLEIVSPPMPLLTAIEKLRQVTDWANDPRGGNAYTNGTTGLHMGVSLPTMKSEDATDDIGIDYVKLILFMGDKYVQQQFGREANNFCASALDKFRQNIKGKKSDPAGVVELLRHGLTELAYRELQKGVGTSKYTSAHIQNGYIEFRSPGGDWLAKSDEEIGILENTMLRFARAMAIAGDPSAERQEYAKKLYKLVTQDNPEYADQLKLFSEFSAGTINKEQLKKQWADSVLQKEIPTTGQEEYEVFDMNKSRSPEGVIDTFYARNYDDANDQYTKKYVNDPRWTQLDVRLKQPWFDVFDDTGKVVATMRARDGDTAQDRAQYEFGQRWTDAWRVYRRPDDAPEPEKKLSPRAQVAKRITTKPKTATQYNYDIVDQRTVELRVVDQFRAETPAEAERVYSAWLKSKDLPDDTANYGYRKNQQAADDQRDSVNIQRTLGIRDVDTDVAQNFSPDYSAYERNSDRIDAIRAQAQQPRQNYELVSDEDPGRVIHRMSNATAEEVRAWIAQQEAGGMPPGFLRTRIVAEGTGQHDDEQTQTALDMAAQDYQYKNWADVDMRGSEQAKTAIRRHAVTKLNLAQHKDFNMLGKSRSAISKGVDQVDREFIDKQIQTARKLGDDVNENFADGKIKGKSRPGRVKRAGASCDGSVTDLRARAKRASGEKAKMYHWCANMKSGKKK